MAGPCVPYGPVDDWRGPAVADAWVGTSGWSYKTWRGRFYPRGLAQRNWLGHYAGHLRSVEVNATFYRLPSEPMIQHWAEATPDHGFRFSLKAWRAITHMKRLRDCGDHLASFFAATRALGRRRGPVLFQLPPKFAKDLERLDTFLAMLPANQRCAMEFRDPSWHDQEVFACLEKHGVAFVPFEIGPLSAPRVVTAPFVYVRLHGREAAYRGLYDEGALRDWAEWLHGERTKGRDIHIYFDNTDTDDDAVRNALRMQALLDGMAGSAP